MAGEVGPLITIDLQKNSQGCFAVAIRDLVRGFRTGEPFQTDRLDNLQILKLLGSCYVAAGMKR
jgi:hypothetical protein